MRPQLLVSVRDPAEASAAIAGGADLIDVKEPDRGPLGAADERTLREIGDEVSRHAERIPLSVALGELGDAVEGRPVPRLPDGVSYCKLGLSTRDLDRWEADWLAARRSVERSSGKSPKWIAVVYADRPHRCPAPEAIIAAARRTDCAGVLVDTYDKDGAGLMTLVDRSTLRRWRDEVVGGGLLFAAAGRLAVADLPALAGVEPSVVAIRGAACDGDRRSTVTCSAVRRFGVALGRAFGAGDSPTPRLERRHRRR